MVDPVTIAVASSTVSVVLARMEAAEDKANAHKIIKNIGEMIDQAKEDIKHELFYLRRQDLDGYILGIGGSLRTYATIDEILRDTDETLGKLTAIVSDFNNFEESRHAYLLYITMIGLECIELVELKFIYSESEVEKKILKIGKTK